MNHQTSVTLLQLAEKLGMAPPISMMEIAEKIGFEKRPVFLTELAVAVDEYIARKNHHKPKI
jgi:hypothetical protein